MTYDELIEKVALKIYNRYQSQMDLHPVTSLKNIKTPLADTCRMEAAMSVAAFRKENS